MIGTMITYIYIISLNNKYKLHDILCTAFLTATLHIAFTEMLILLFICILGELSLTRDLASASANK